MECLKKKKKTPCTIALSPLHQLLQFEGQQTNKKWLRSPNKTSIKNLFPFMTNLFILRSKLALIKWPFYGPVCQNQRSDIVCWSLKWTYVTTSLSQLPSFTSTWSKRKQCALHAPSFGSEVCVCVCVCVCIVCVCVFCLLWFPHPLWT
jgi:hypothetical protein